MTTTAAAPITEDMRYDVQADAACASVLQRGAWGTFKERHGWDVARSAGDAFAVQMLLKRKFGVTIGYLPRGPAVDWNDAVAVAGCFRALDALCKRESVALALIEPDAGVPANFN